MIEPHTGDLEAARQIQTSLLPSSPLSVGSWEVAGSLLAVGECDRVFDYYPIDDGRCALSIISVPKTGIDAARLMSDFHALQRAHCNGSAPVSEEMTRLNEQVLKSLDAGDEPRSQLSPHELARWRLEQGRYISMFYAEFDSNGCVLRYSSTSPHSFPLLIRRDGSLESLNEASSLMLGLVADKPFDVAQLTLEAGDFVLLYDSNLVRALDPLLIGFEAERLRAIWQLCADAGPEEVVATIFGAIETFRDRALLGSVETLPGVNEMAQGPCPLGDVVPFRMEAHRIRERAAQRDDIVLVVLGQASIQKDSLG